MTYSKLYGTENQARSAQIQKLAGLLKQARSLNQAGKGQVNPAQKLAGLLKQARRLNQAKEARIHPVHIQKLAGLLKQAKDSVQTKAGTRPAQMRKLAALIKLAKKWQELSYAERRQAEQNMHHQLAYQLYGIQDKKGNPLYAGVQWLPEQRRGFWGSIGHSIRNWFAPEHRFESDYTWINPQTGRRQAIPENVKIDLNPGSHGNLGAMAAWSDPTQQRAILDKRNPKHWWNIFGMGQDARNKAAQAIASSEWISKTYPQALQRQLFELDQRGWPKGQFVRTGAGGWQYQITPEGRRRFQKLRQAVRSGNIGSVSNPSGAGGQLLGPAEKSKYEALRSRLDRWRNENYVPEKNYQNTQAQVRQVAQTSRPGLRPGGAPVPGRGPLGGSLRRTSGTAYA